MCEDLQLVLLICVVVLLLKLTMSNKDFLVARPNSNKREGMVKNIMAHKVLFEKSDLNTAKYKMPWLDAITYEEVRSLILSNKFNAENIRRLLV